MRPLRYPVLWLLPALVWSAWLGYASLMPVPGSATYLPDKLLHIGSYAVLLYLLACCFKASALPVLVLLAAGMGLAIEFLQGMTGYRGFEWMDALANLTGAVTGALLGSTPLGHAFLHLERMTCGA